MWESWDSNNYDYNKDGEGSIVICMSSPLADLVRRASVCVYTLSMMLPGMASVR